MKRFEVEVMISGCARIIVEANNEDEAMDKVDKMHDDEILDADPGCLDFEIDSAEEIKDE
jgi:hypothetical protein